VVWLRRGRGVHVSVIDAIAARLSRSAGPITGIPEGQKHPVIAPLFVGGGFGSKLRQAAEEVLSSIAPQVWARVRSVDGYSLI